MVGDGMGAALQVCIRLGRTVNQMGKTHSKPLAARHGKGTAWARHVMCESAFKLPKDAEVTERHTAKQTCDCLLFCRLVVMGDLSFSPDLVSNDLHLFVSFRKHLVGHLQRTLT